MAKSSLTPQMLLNLCDQLRKGHFPETAAALCGITKQTLVKWIRRASEPGAPKIYIDLALSIERAQAEAEARELEIIRICSQGYRPKYDESGKLVMAGRNPNWQAAAWLLERRHPKKWGKREQVNLTTGDEDRPIDLDKIKRQNEELMAALGYIKK